MKEQLHGVRTMVSRISTTIRMVVFLHIVLSAIGMWHYANGGVWTDLLAAIGFGICASVSLFAYLRKL